METTLTHKANGVQQNAGFSFKKATKKESKLRMALNGPSGSGKTYSALSIASGLSNKIAVIDTEHGSASKYADLFEFDVLELSSFHPQSYIDGITVAVLAGYEVVIIDSLSHAWNGKDGALELVDKAAKKMQTSNTFGAWRDVTPLQNKLVEAIIAAPVHIIATMRTKMEYVQEKDEKTGKTTIRKVGLAPVQREGMEYEFDIVGEINLDNALSISKSRFAELSHSFIEKPDSTLGIQIRQWLSGEPSELDILRTEILELLKSKWIPEEVLTKSQNMMPTITKEVAIKLKARLNDVIREESANHQDEIFPDNHDQTKTSEYGEGKL